MKAILPLICLYFFLSPLIGQTDTVMVDVFENETMKWYEGYRNTAEFPDGEDSYRRVNMHFTLGCPDSGCSDWDYTVLIKAFRPTGELDSSIVRIDTLSNNPLELDTVWNVTEVKESFELGRMITPYGGYMARGSNGFDNSWEHRYVYDVTDYALLLQDSVEFEIFYQGWSSGFSADLKFEMIEGTPPREVVAIENLYRPGSYNYIEADTFEARHMPPKDISVPSGATSTILHFLPTGHGFVNALNCAEFCSRFYFVRSMGITIDEQPMWRNDCGYNPIYPQGGTWLFNRANWCPGSEAIRYEHDLSDAIINGVIEDLNVDIEPYEYTVPAGEVPANYNISAVLIHHAGYTHEEDANLVDILQPSNHEAHSRFNPACGTARVKVQNTGGNPITSLEIQYGIEEFSTFEWTGFLAPMKEVEIEMPYTESVSWSGEQSNPVFEAEIISVNGQADAYPANNKLQSNFDIVPVIQKDIKLVIRTNTRPQENYWTLRDLNQNTIYEEDNLQANQSQSWNWELTNGCYHFTLFDADGDGLAFFANNDGSGSVSFRDANAPIPTPVETFNADFGSRLDYYFRYEGTVSSAVEDVSGIRIFPNPSSEFVVVEWPKTQLGQKSIQVRTPAGQEFKTIREGSGDRWRFSTSDWANGMYLLQMQMGEKQITKKIVIQH
ncbi:MAG: T9SS type A sorting domain-containing protein [Bacteroidetes bacterium]|jgi:hypothetical protein|nr:T9SS type A sorting domain-containing protein [Bacteroidota bacterium]